MFGYSAGKFTTNSLFGRVSSDFSLDDVRCVGTERSIADCEHTTKENCGAAEGAGVQCFQERMLTKLFLFLPPLTLSHAGFELLGGSGPHEGNLFVNRKPVCDDHFTEEAHGPMNAYVVCR